jgi:hypothetical protein
MNELQEFIWNRSNAFMKRIAILHAQYLLLRNCINYGAPKLLKVKKFVTMKDISPHEWDIVKHVEDIEKDYMCQLFNKFQPARTAIRTCEGVFNNLQQICKLTMEQGNEGSPELVNRIRQLERWIRSLDDRKKPRSESQIRTNHLELVLSGQQNLHADWAL